VMISILISGMLASSVPRLLTYRLTFPGESSVAMILLFPALVGFMGLMLTSGATIYDPDKDVVMESLDRWHILFYSSVTLGFPLAVHARRYVLGTVYFSFLLFNLYLGFRSPLAISVIAAVVIILHAKGPQRLAFSNWPIIVVCLVFGAFMFAYKMIAFAVKAGLWDTVWDRLLDSEALWFMLTRSEPFLVQQTLNEVVMSNFTTGYDHIISSLYQFLLLAPELGAENVTFNGIFQPALFPEVEYGLAANIWAQMWSAGGWPLLFLFAIIFNLVLAIGNTTLAARSMVVRGGLAPVFCYWAFYIHRNELSFALALEKRLLLLLAGATIAAVVLSLARTPMEAERC
jgi:hypothetical protein